MPHRVFRRSPSGERLKPFVAFLYHLRSLYMSDGHYPLCRNKVKEIRKSWNLSKTHLSPHHEYPANSHEGIIYTLCLVCRTCDTGAIQAMAREIRSEREALQDAL